MFTGSLSRIEYMVQLQTPLLTIGSAGGPATPLEAARIITTNRAAQALIVAGLGSGNYSDAFDFYVDFMGSLFTSQPEELSSLELFLVRLINSRPSRTAA